jgi:hypothetical protein
MLTFLSIGCHKEKTEPNIKEAENEKIKPINRLPCCF